jgi:hypothetical protein
MPRQSLASALRTALEAGRNSAANANKSANPLIEAIRNSATRMDQIVRRRIGLNDEPPKDLK